MIFIVMRMSFEIIRGEVVQLTKKLEDIIDSTYVIGGIGEIDYIVLGFFS